MCLTATPAGTAAFRKKNKGKKTVPCWKVFNVRKDLASGRVNGVVSSVRGTAWYPDTWVNAGVPVSRLDSPAKLKNGRTKRRDFTREGVHVFTSLEAAKKGAEWGGLVIPVEVEMKYLVAANYGPVQQACFKRVRILKKDYPR